MPTRGGWLIGLSSLIAGLGGRLLGLKELFLLAAAAAALLFGALAYVHSRRFVLSARRLLLPGRLPAGASCRVELRVTNGGRRPSPVLLLADGSHRPFLLAPLDGGEQVQTSYRLNEVRRGLHPVGPLCVRLRDPFGLASRTVSVLAPNTLTVHPRIDSIALPPDSPGAPAVGGPRRATPTPMADADFHALRPYEEGDDLRLVHWPTSARLDAMVVRQGEAPRLRQTTVAVDLRRSIHDAATLERVVSAAASLAAAACEDDGVVRLVTTGGLDSGNAGGESHLASVVDALAVVGCDASSGLAGLAKAMGDGEAGMAMLITTSAASGDLGIVARLHPQYPMIVAVVFERAADERVVPDSAARSPFDRVVMVGHRQSFRRVWERSVSPLLIDG